jgi:polyisoprenoid-binding protein YceI
MAETKKTTYTIDPHHSSVEFGVKHMGVSRVKGRLRDLSGILHIDEAVPADSWVQVTIGARSIDTGLAQRDEHLRSSDFLNVRWFPEIRFKSTKAERIDADHWRVYGDLSMRGITRPVVLDVAFEGRIVDVEGIERLGVSARTSLNRRDFGMVWNDWMGRYLVGDEIRVEIEIEALREGGPHAG